MDKSAEDPGVKKERFDEDIKEFAESTMNEMLGWYGYEPSRRDRLKMAPGAYRPHSQNSTSSGSDSPKYGTNEGCGWCGKQVDATAGLLTSTSSSFCSELCFSQSRRANFKRNKTCDWCRHVRHTVSYVDFQDGASQLQFCSDKCLNQYKMQIFCRETRAHLELHPHPPGGALEPDAAPLITPELWLKNCRSPSESRSPSPRSADSPEPDLLQTSPLPLITLTHPSKLLAAATRTVSPVPEVANRQNRLKNRPVRTPRKPRKRCPNSPLKTLLDVPQDLRIIKPAHTTHQDHCSKRSNVHQEHPSSNSQNPGNYCGNSNVLPPVTVLVPYPILFPVPLPIPIPLPISSFLKAEARERSTSSPMNVNSSQSQSQNQNEAKVATEDDGRKRESNGNGNGLLQQQQPPLRKKKRVVDSAKSKIPKNSAYLPTTTTPT